MPAIVPSLAGGSGSGGQQQALTSVRPRGHVVVGGISVVPVKVSIKTALPIRCKGVDAIAANQGFSGAGGGLARACIVSRHGNAAAAAANASNTANTANTAACLPCSASPHSAAAQCSGDASQ